MVISKQKIRARHIRQYASGVAVGPVIVTTGRLPPPYAMPIPFSDCNRNHPSQPGVDSQILIKAKPIPLSDCNSHQVNLEVDSQIIIKAMPNMLYIQIILTVCVCHFFIEISPTS